MANGEGSSLNIRGDGESKKLTGVGDGEKKMANQTKGKMIDQWK